MRFPFWGQGLADVLRGSLIIRWVCLWIVLLVALPNLGCSGDPAAVWIEAERALGLGVDERILVQRGLLELGHDPGQASGLLGSGTRDAIRRWQTSEGVQATGYLTAEQAQVLQWAGERALADFAEAQRMDEERAHAESQAEAERLAAAVERELFLRRFRDCAVCPQMIEVPAGSFVMGARFGEEGADDNELPRRPVTIGYPLAIGVYEVTFAEWDACVADGGCGGYSPDDEGWGRGALPVVNVRPDDAQGYVEWLSGETGAGYRLLSEAEWEYAARAGTDTRYAWGDSIGIGRAHCSGCGTRREFDWLAPVGSFAPNAFGLYDMHGNAWEWTEDCWNSRYDREGGSPTDGSPWLSGNCDLNVLRGGSWRSGAEPPPLREPFLEDELGSGQTSLEPMSGSA